MGYLYAQTFTDLNFIKGQNIMNTSGLVYNLNETTVFTYAPGDSLSIVKILVYTNGVYNEVNSTIIETQYINTTLYQPDSGPPLISTTTPGINWLVIGAASALLVATIGALVFIIKRQRQGIKKIQPS